MIRQLTLENSLLKRQLAAALSDNPELSAVHRANDILVRATAGLVLDADNEVANGLFQSMSDAGLLLDKAIHGKGEDE